MPTAIRVVLETLGCKLNQAETESLARELGAAGFCIVASGEASDIYILNACTVTATADAKVRHLLSRAHRQIPPPVLVLTGCCNEGEASFGRVMQGARVFVCRDKSAIVPLLQGLGYSGAGAGRLPRGRTRAMVKAQEGCRNYCTYCIVPFMRGQEKSRPPDDVIGEVDARVWDGYQEVVLTGTEIGAYSHDNLGISELVCRILEETGVTRLRLSSLQPVEVTEALLRLGGSGRLCPHFHLSLQSGCDSVLSRMRRRYDTAGYQDAIKRIRAMMPEAAITTDVIVGFPGETEVEFEESYRFCASVGFARIHVFPFSPRPGTVAADMPDQVAPSIKRERSRRFLTLARESAEVFRTAFLGKALMVLWEGEARGIMSGYTGNYIRVYSGVGAGLVNEVTDVRITKLYRDGVWGETTGGAI